MKKLYNLSMIFTVLMLTAWGCSESNPVDHDHEDEHAEASGMILVQGADTLVTAQDQLVDGKINLVANQSSGLIRIYFIAEDGDYFVPDEPELTFNWEIADEGIVGMQENEGGDWEFALMGKQAGTTTVRFKIFHEGHPDFVSLPVPVEVTE